VLALYKEAAALRAGSGSADATATLARMAEWGWDGVSDLTTYVPRDAAWAATAAHAADVRAADTTGGGGGDGTDGAGWAGGSIATATRVWAQLTHWLGAHVPGFAAMQRAGGSAGSRSLTWLRDALWAPLQADVRGGSGTGGTGGAGSGAGGGGATADVTHTSPQLLVPQDVKEAVRLYRVAAELVRALVGGCACGGGGSRRRPGHFLV
jgi:hypothetical protein